MTRIFITNLGKYNEEELVGKMLSEVIGVSQKTVEAWETGTNKPTGSALRLLQLIKADSNILEHMFIGNYYKHFEKHFQNPKSINMPTEQIDYSRIILRSC